MQLLHLDGNADCSRCGRFTASVNDSGRYAQAGPSPENGAGAVAEDITAQCQRLQRALEQLEQLRNDRRQSQRTLSQSPQPLVCTLKLCWDACSLPR
jgi:hypothetical protein